MLNWLNITRTMSLNTKAGSSLAALVLAGLIGCGGSSTPSPTPQPGPSPQPGATQVQVNLGDAPADRIVAFAMTMNSLSMTGGTGATVNVLTAPATLEMMHLMGAMQPLGMVSMPQGTYSQANMVMGSAVVSYLDSAFTTLTGATTLVVFQQSGTEFFGMASVANGNTVRVRGLLFFDAGKWKLVASRMMMP